MGAESNQPAIFLSYALLELSEDEQCTIRLRRAESIGRPVGSEAWLAGLEAQRGCKLAPAKRGAKRRELSALSP